MNLLPIAALAGLVIIYNSKKKPTTSSTKPDKKPYPEAPETPSDEKFEDFPDTVNKELNIKNVEKYYSNKAHLIIDVPYIYEDLTPELQKTYDPKQTPAYSQSFIYINPEFAAEVWEMARFVASNGIFQDGKIIKPTSKSLADPFTKTILEKLAPDVYWAEGMIPYKYQSPFYYVWISVNFLVRLAWATIQSAEGNMIGITLPKSPVE